MAAYREEEDPFEEDIVFDQAGLLNNTSKMNTAIRRVSSGKCVLFAKTLGLCGAFFGLGLCIAIPGPTFLSPLTALEVNVSNIYVARSSGYLIGAIIGGMLFDHFNRLFLLFLSLLLTSVFITVAPWCQLLWLQVGCMVALGITMGFLDTGGNVLCLDLWGRNSGPFMQALHFSFGLGAFVAPLLAVPFLEPTALNATFNMDVSHVVTENPVHIIKAPGAAAFQFDKTQRMRREIENITESSILMSTSVIPDPHEDGLLNTNSTVLVPNTTVRQRISIHKPSKTDGTKLGNKNWEGVHVGKPPLADLIPATTTVTTKNTILTPTLTSPSVTYGDLSDSTTTEKVMTTLEENMTYPVNIETDANGTHSLIYKNTSDDFVSDDHPKTELAALMSNSTQHSIYMSTDHKTTTQTLVDIGMTPELNSIITISEMESLTELNDNAASDVPTEGSNILESFPQLNISPYPPVSTQMKINASILSIYSSTTLSTPSYNHSVDENQEQNRTKEFQQSVQDRHVTKGNSLGHEEFYVQDKRRGESLDANSETSFSNLRSLSINEQVTKEINETSVESITVPRQKEITSPLSYITSSISKHVHRKPGTFDNDTEHINTIFDIFANRIEKYGFSKLQFSYLIVGIFVFSISVVFLGFLCHNPRDPKSKQEEGRGAKKITNKTLHKTLVGLMAFFFFLYMGMEVTYGQLVLAFAMHSNLKLPQSTGSVISVVFWGSFAAMRFASIFFASGFSPVTMIMLNFAFCTTGTILVSALANHMETALWVGTALIGIGLASMFPTGILWIERYIHVSNKVAAIFVIGVSLGEMICPVTIYRLMVNDPLMLMHSALVINILCILTFAALWWLASRQGEKYSVVINNGYQLANQNDEEEDMMDMSPSGSAVTLRRHSFSSEHRALLNGNIHRGP